MQGADAMTLQVRLKQLLEQMNKQSERTNELKEQINGMENKIDKQRNEMREIGSTNLRIDEVDNGLKGYRTYSMWMP